MRIPPNWRPALAVWLLYNSVVYLTWWAVAADYRDLSSSPVVMQRFVLPMALGALFVVVATSLLGWWRAAMTENMGRPLVRWPLWALPASMLGFAAANLAATRWPELSFAHLVMLGAGSLMVGFNEELVTRGVVLTGLRGSGQTESGVWFWSSVLFGAMHLPNAFFGLPLAAGLVQGVAAFLMGCAFYALRRISGALWLPMVLHGLWDFSSLTLQASGGAHSHALYFQLATYVLAAWAVVAVLRHSRGAL